MGESFLSLDGPTEGLEGGHKPHKGSHYLAVVSDEAPVKVGEA